MESILSQPQCVNILPPSIMDESKLHQQLEEVDEMFRSVLASSAAGHLLDKSVTKLCRDRCVAPKI